MSDTDPLYATANFSILWADTTAVDIHYDNDYLVPLLLSNPNYGAFFARHFPAREVFHGLAAFLFRLAPAHAAAAEAFRGANLGAPAGEEAFVIGLQAGGPNPLKPSDPHKTVNYNQASQNMERFPLIPDVNPPQKS